MFSFVANYGFYLVLILLGALLFSLAIRAWSNRHTLPGEVQRLPRSRTWATPIEPPPPRRGTLIPLLALVLLAHPACTARQAKIGALDFAACAGADVVLPSVAGLARQLVGRTDWQTWGLTQLAGALGPATACGLHALATALRADAPRPVADDLAVLRRLAARCGPAGTCQGAEERAAWILWRASGRPFPPSGEG